MSHTVSIPATENEAWGFIGAMGVHAPAAWPLAMSAVAEATGQSLEAVRAFLDSRWGRHFANDVLNSLHEGTTLPAAILTAVDRWMTWRVGAKIAAHHGIPQGTAHLLGFVALAALEERLV
ncbi:hypothetical protein OOT46_00010 [Aquabacterium sp. A7-Y]|uniref:hypothetical protein n=1 Tax=Aquabacterium sp. A7-Y TaxID=1349605 RepID=UPI00223D2FC3|nr:hypothetical protein [Aquabacterium sp. A7-Y]MCW7536238.1 hypothetical protein [Aquabacterium sp. A7-Y]